MEIKLDKLKSRKLWIVVLAATLVSLGSQLGFDLNPEEMQNLVYLVCSYVLGQAWVDGKK